MTTALEEAVLPIEVVEEPRRRPVGADEETADAAPSETLREPNEGLRGSRARMGTAPAAAAEGTGGGGDCGGRCRGSTLKLPSRVAGRKGRPEEEVDEGEKMAELKRGEAGGSCAWVAWLWWCCWCGMTGDWCAACGARVVSSRGLVWVRG